MIFVGVALLLMGLMFDFGLLAYLGIMFVIGGMFLFVLGSVGRAVGGRRHYY